MGQQIDPILDLARNVELYGRHSELKECLQREDYAGALRICRETAAVDYVPLPGIAATGLLTIRNQNLELLQRLRAEIAGAARDGQKKRLIQK